MLSFHTLRQSSPATISALLVWLWLLSFLLNSPHKLIRQVASFWPFYEETVCSVKPSVKVVSIHIRLTHVSGALLLWFFKGLNPVPPFSKSLPILAWTQTLTEKYNPSSQKQIRKGRTTRLKVSITPLKHRLRWCLELFLSFKISI